MRKTNRFKMREKVWLYPGETANWHFVNVPKKQAEIIRERFGAKHRGWSSLPVGVKVGKTVWKTSIFYDRRSHTYILPLKAAVRKKEDVMRGDTITFGIEILI